MRIDPVERLRVRVERAGLLNVHGGHDALTDLRQTYARAGLDHSGIHTQPARVDDLRVGGNLHVRAHGGDLAAADDDRAVREFGAADREHAAVPDRERALRSGSRVEAAELRARRRGGTEGGYD